MAVKIDNYLWGVTSLIKMQANMNSLNCHYLESHRAHEGFSLHVFLWVGKGEHAWANEISLHAIIKRKKSNCIYIYICMLRLEITKHLNICSFLCTDSGFNSPLFYFSPHLSICKAELKMLSCWFGSSHFALICMVLLRKGESEPETSECVSSENCQAGICILLLPCGSRLGIQIPNCTHTGDCYLPMMDKPSSRSKIISLSEVWMKVISPIVK